ncbi:MAG TPA: CCA tRNA nucleotidyltransferase [Bdellovibrionales bacterium]|jgi:poly(A) polymerase|nr:CCA tRNA nucleotidyltransferase [Bdellovibrionales bacterium]
MDLFISVKAVKPFENHEQWNAVKEVCLRLNEAGFEALLAGGCVRDMIMGREPNDFDVATSATPDQVEALFPKSVGVGKAFGVMILPFEGFQVEVATFREDLEYKDGRRPEGVRFSTAQADSKRRDFTVNALFFDPLKNQVIDYIDGQKDIQRKLLRTVGLANHRFDEDKLRLLRAVRFAAQLDFDIEHETLQAVIERSSEVGVVSRERIRDELLKLLHTPKRLKGLMLLLSTGLLSGAFPESAPFILEEETNWLKRFEFVKPSESDAVLLALFFYPVFKRTGEQDFKNRHLKTLKLDTAISNEIVHLLNNVESVLKPSEIRKGELAETLFDAKSTHLKEFGDVLAKTENAVESDRVQWIETVTQTAAPYREAFLNGADLKAIGMQPGPRMGEILREAQLLQYEGILTSRDAALNWLGQQKT